MLSHYIQYIVIIALELKIFQDNKTALYWATEKGYVDIVRLILSANPNCEIATKVRFIY